MKLAIFGILFVIATVSAKDGFISIYNNGEYTARFSIQYDIAGNRNTLSSGDFIYGVTKSLNIPEAASNINVIAEEYLIPGTVYTIFTISFPEAVQQCYNVAGTTLNPTYTAKNC